MEKKQSRQRKSESVVEANGMLRRPDGLKETRVLVVELTLYHHWPVVRESS